MAACPVCGMTAPHDGPCPCSLSRRSLVLQKRYDLIGILGQGGMGTVYMARDMHLHNRPCVVKKLRDDFYAEEDKQKAVSFFKREAGVLSRLKHPNIVRILDYFEENSDYFLVMEYVEGRDLHDVLLERGQPFPEEQVLEWARQICEVLEYLHGHDPAVIYRDLKPSNIMIDMKGKVQLVDFGIARPVEDGGDHTHVVSAGYSPPEQYWGSADPRSDIYALGATMHFLLTGNEPVALHLSSPTGLNPEVSARTDAIVQRATAQDPNLRYQSAHEMRAALEKPPVAPDSSPAHKPIPLVILGALLVLFTALTYLGYQKLTEAINADRQKIQDKEATLKKTLEEKEQLSNRLQAYKRAAEAQHKSALTSQPTATEHNRETTSSLSAQATSEQDLTDPGGLSE